MVELGYILYRFLIIRGFLFRFLFFCVFLVVNVDVFIYVLGFDFWFKLYLSVGKGVVLERVWLISVWDLRFLILGRFVLFYYVVMVRFEVLEFKYLLGLVEEYFRSTGFWIYFFEILV